jgi:integration host factor subunit alpha
LWRTLALVNLPTAEIPLADTDTPPLVTIDQLQFATLTKAQLVDMLSERIGLNKREAREMVDTLFGLIAERLLAGEDVRLSGFGNFQTRLKSARPGRNPRTGEQIPIKARRVVTFRAGQKLRAVVQGGASGSDAG